VSAAATPLGIDTGLLARFRDAGAKIAWRSAPGSGRASARATVRVAHLNDEESRVDTRANGREVRVTVDSGPVGALVLLLEADARGPPRRLEPLEAGRAPGHPGGALRAIWAPSGPEGGPITVHDLAELARYALA
jgi:hypothetical protein